MDVIMEMARIKDYALQWALMGIVYIANVTGVIMLIAASFTKRFSILK